MKKLVYNKQISLLFSIFAIAILFIGLLFKECLNESTWSFDPKILNSGAWTPILHKSFNSFILWKRLKFLSFSSNIYFELTGFSLLFIFNLTILLKHLKTNLVFSLLSATSISLILLSLFGIDIFLVKAISFSPLLIFAILKIKNTWIRTFFILTISSLINLLSFSLTPLILFFVLLSIYLLDSKKFNLYLILTIFIPSIIFFNSYTLTPKTDYPNNAKVVEDDGLPGHLRPAFANMSNIPFVNRVLVRDLNKEAALFLLILIFAFYLKEFILNRSLKNRNANILLILSALILADVALPEEFASIFPLATLKRLIPYFYHYPLAPYFLLFLVIKFIFSYAKENKQLSISLFLLVFSAYLAFKNSPALIEKNLTLLVKNSEVKDYQEFNIVSPAYALIPKLGIKVFSKKEELSKLKFKKLNPYNVRVSKANFREGSKRKFIFDNNPATRFRTKEQHGKEWIHLAFKRKKLIKGLALQTGHFSSDFPRGVRVSSKENCEFDVLDNKNKLTGYQEVYKKENWVGSYEFTKSGLLYLTPEGIVNLVFDREISTKCLLIEQISSDDYFDWSISEIKVFK